MNNDSRLRLAFVGMHPDRSGTLLKEQSAGAVLNRIASGSIQVPDHARASALVEPDVRRKELEDLGVSILYRGSSGFPAFLADLPDSPDVLFVKGELPQEPGVAIVGTRRATSYGRALARQFGAALASAGWPVISGLARGIDIAAHEGTVGIGRAAAVLGCGIDRWYPSGHRRVGEALIAGGGAVVSEYPPGVPPNGWRFPPRNRIISGLSSVVVVVEAAAKGGALITARIATEQGRDVFAVPGDVDRASSEGCNLLIRDGAWPLFGAEDLVESVARVMGDPPRQQQLARPSSRLLDQLGGYRRPLDWVIEAMGEPSHLVLAEIGRLEALGLVHHESGHIAPVLVTEP